MIMNFELPLKCWLDSKVLALAKSYMTFDVYNKHSKQNIQTFIFFRGKSYLPSMLFCYRKISIKNIFTHEIFIY